MIVEVRLVVGFLWAVVQPEWKLEGGRAAECMRPEEPRVGGLAGVREPKSNPLGVMDGAGVNAVTTPRYLLELG